MNITNDKLALMLKDAVYNKVDDTLWVHTQCGCELEYDGVSIQGLFYTDDNEPIALTKEQTTLLEQLFEVELQVLIQKSKDNDSIKRQQDRGITQYLNDQATSLNNYIKNQY